MEMSGLLDVPTVLPPEKDAIPIVYEATWAPLLSLVCRLILRLEISLIISPDSYQVN
jgi:hypothetical protein